VTDRIDYLTVGLTQDVREDDIDAIVTALRMVKGVLTVEPHVADGSSASLERIRFATAVRGRLLAAVDEALRDA
jgi:hypothetical protein